MSVDTARWGACATMVAQTLVFAASRLVSTLALIKHKLLFIFDLAGML
jgi:hypothetical protein